jgi:hypothetical protein
MTASAPANAALPFAGQEVALRQAVGQGQQLHLDPLQHVRINIGHALRLQRGQNGARVQQGFGKPVVIDGWQARDMADQRFDLKGQRARIVGIE